MDEKHLAEEPEFILTIIEESGEVVRVANICEITTIKYLLMNREIFIKAFNGAYTKKSELDGPAMVSVFIRQIGRFDSLRNDRAFVLEVIRNVEWLAKMTANNPKLAEGIIISLISTIEKQCGETANCSKISNGIQTLCGYVSRQLTYEYIGCFIPRDTILSVIEGIDRSPLAKPIDDTHVTFAYMPIQVDESLFGESVRIRIKGYGNDGENEGLLVELSTDNSSLNKMIEQIPTPHITLSVSETGKAVNTRFIEFHDIEPVECVGTFSGCFFNGSIKQ